jgi:hypothetical protein
MPPVIAAQTSVAAPVKDFAYRAVSDVTIFFPPRAIPTTALVDVLRKRPDSETVLMSWGMNTQGCLQWVAPPRAELIFPNGQVFGFRVTPAHVDATAQIISCVDPPGSRPKEWKEAHWEDIYDVDEYGDDADEDVDFNNPKIIDRRWVAGHFRERLRLVAETYEWRDGALSNSFAAVLDPRDEALTSRD